MGIASFFSLIFVLSSLIGWNIQQAKSIKILTELSEINESERIKMMAEIKVLQNIISNIIIKDNSK